MAVTLPLAKMTIEEKIQAMEMLWDDLCVDPSRIPSPEWHEEVLKEREETNIKYIDWETAKGQLKKDL
jgi:hypothetical protein